MPHPHVLFFLLVALLTSPWGNVPFILISFLSTLMMVFNVEVKQFTVVSLPSVINFVYISKFQFCPLCQRYVLYYFVYKICLCYYVISCILPCLSVGLSLFFSQELSMACRFILCIVSFFQYILVCLFRWYILISSSFLSVTSFISNSNNSLSYFL